PHEALARDLPDDRERVLPALLRGTDIEQHELVGILVVEDANRVDRIPDVLGLGEARGLDQAAAAQQHGWNDANPEPDQQRSAKLSSNCIPNLWVFSGWNCTPHRLSRRNAAWNGSPCELVSSTSSGRSHCTKYECTK